MFQTQLKGFSIVLLFGHIFFLVSRIFDLVSRIICYLWMKDQLRLLPSIDSTKKSKIESTNKTSLFITVMLSHKSSSSRYSGSRRDNFYSSGFIKFRTRGLLSAFPKQMESSADGFRSFVWTLTFIRNGERKRHWERRSIDCYLLVILSTILWDNLSWAFSRG